MSHASILSNCTSGGCGAKIGPGELSSLLENLPKFSDPNLVVGFDSRDDAAVYEIDGERAVISTVDFFSPMVDDPRTFGRIAAANAMSDVWAMGGRVLFALNLLCFPEAADRLVAGEILSGGMEKLAEAGAALGGGHSIYDRELKYGLAVTGMVETGRLRRNNTPVPGHKVILTKPLGTGIIMAAARGGLASPGAVREAVSTMERLNKRASEHMGSFNASACTDVTGFGLLVHAMEMASNGCGMRICPDSLPVLPFAESYADEFLLTAAGQRNRNYAGGMVDVSSLPFATQELLFDPQTSGGLLIAAPPDEAMPLLGAIRGDDPAAAMIGEIIPPSDKIIEFI
jgi:selenide,water dikinase